VHLSNKSPARCHTASYWGVIPEILPNLEMNAADSDGASQ
jgi:hypothetical protein